MISLPVDATDAIVVQLAILNITVMAYAMCKGLNWCASVVFRRAPPKKSIRPELARSDESNLTGRGGT